MSPRVLTDRDTADETCQPLGVIAWRMDQLIEAGYPVLSAMRLAEKPDVDLHQACDLLKRGASVSEALRILF